MSYDGEYDASEYPNGIHAPRLGYRGAREMAEKDRQIEALRADNARLRIELEEAQLRSIEARNPGIDMDEVRRSRGAGATDESER